MPSAFLTAQWRRLVMLNYAIEPERLLPFLPAHTELDIWNDTCYVSLVGFRFLDTRLKGIAIPFHRDFTEINLRFYVRRNDPQTGWKRGVVFISELVPLPAIAWVANTVYREHYGVRTMRHQWFEEREMKQTEYAWRQHGRWHSFGVQTDPAPVVMKPGSEAEFITEHYWGYARRNATQTIEYQVEHPRWEVYPIRAWHGEVDFGAVYGPAFSDLNTKDPVSVFLAEGSEVVVRSRTVIG
ncbi:MAG: DUF2071 domain-containing protein [Bacteroidetes bacterium]|nr:DUF2071 domain-containing protein [Bacteroidota bacterium]